MWDPEEDELVHKDKAYEEATDFINSDLEAMGESELVKVSRHLEACSLLSMYRKEVSYV